MKSLLAALTLLALAAPAFAVGPITVTLNPGWNAVAFQGPSLTSLSPGSGVASLATFQDGSYRNESVTTASVNSGAAGRRGFYVFATTATNLTYSADDDATRSLSLASGWNLISFSSSTQIAGSSLTALNASGQSVALGSLVVTSFYEIGTTNQYTVRDVAAGGSLAPGRPYWVFAAAPGTLRWGSSSPSASPSPAAFWVDRFTIGSTQALNFTMDAGARSTHDGPPRVMALPDGRIRLLYPQSGGIGSSISTDGLNFTEEAGLRLTGVVPDPAIIYLSDGRFRLLAASGSSTSQTLVSAISTDGFSFTLEAGTRYMPTAADAGMIGVPHAMRLPDGRWRLYYVGDLMGGNNVRTAISSDEGLTFTSEGATTLPAARVDPDGLYLLSGGVRLYLKFGADMFTGDSSDGRTFPAGVSTSALAGFSDHFDPTLIKLPDGRIRAYFGNQAGQGIGSATSP